jgi:uncharacterized protein (DUF342 family)
MDTKERGEKIVVSVAQDGMSATLMLPSTLEDESVYTYEEVEKALLQANVTYGLDEETIHRMVDAKIYDTEMTIAQGNPAQDGVDGVYHFHFSTELTGKPQIKEDGSIDYYNVKLFETVEKGDVLADYELPTKGEPGCKVTGNVVPPKPGKPLPQLHGKGFTMSNDGQFYTADLDGKIEYHNYNLVILPILEISGDVDLNVGNIDFNGDVKISGNVISGIQIKARGSITIDGYVEGASIISEENIIFNKGVNLKKNGIIKAKGDITAEFLENALVQTDGNVQAGYILNSTVIACGTVVVKGRKGVIHGGDVTGIMGVDAGSTGTPTYAPSIIQVGPTRRLRREYAELLMNLKEINTTIDTLDAVMEKYNQIRSVAPEKIDMETYKKVLQSCVIKKTEKSECELKIKNVYDLIRKSGRSVVRVKKVLYPGTRIFIDDKLFEAREELSHVMVRKFNNDIILQDFEE